VGSYVLTKYDKDASLDDEDEIPLPVPGMSAPRKRMTNPEYIIISLRQLVLCQDVSGKTTTVEALEERVRDITQLEESRSNPAASTPDEVALTAAEWASIPSLIESEFVFGIE